VCEECQVTRCSVLNTRDELGSSGVNNKMCAPSADAAWLDLEEPRLATPPVHLCSNAQTCAGDYYMLGRAVCGPLRRCGGLAGPSRRHKPTRNQNMSFQLKRGKPVARELSRIVAKELETAIDQLGRRPSVDRAEAVHEARKSVKKTRAVLRLLKQNLGDDYGVLGGRLRSMAHQLSSLRDVDAGPEMMNALRDHYPRIVTRSMSRAVQRILKTRRFTRGAVASRITGITCGCSKVAPAARRSAFDG
jgi:hypothetical protein